MTRQMMGWADGKPVGHAGDEVSHSHGAHRVVTLIYGARDTTCNNAEALRLWLEAGAGGC